MRHHVHLDELHQHPVQRAGMYARTALGAAGALFSWLPFGDAATQAAALLHASASPKRKDQQAIGEWAELVRGHALDFHADAGQEGGCWQYAVADAWETWLMLRERYVQPPGWPWNHAIAQFRARGMVDGEDWVDPESLRFGGEDQAWKRADMSDWRRGAARLADEQAGLDAHHLAQAWPGVDLPTLALAVGALWAVALPGWVMGAQQLEMGGARGRHCLVLTHWN